MSTLPFLPPDVQVQAEWSQGTNLPTAWPEAFRAVVAAALRGVSGPELEKLARAAVKAQYFVRNHWLFWDNEKLPDYDSLYAATGHDRRAATAATTFLNVLFTVVVEAAEDLRSKVSAASAKVLDASQRAQELDAFVGRWYMALSAHATSREGRLWSATQEVASAGRKSALQWYSHVSGGGDFEGWEEAALLADEGKVARAVLGQDAYPMIEALSAHRIQVGVGGTHSGAYRGGYINSEPRGSVFGPPIFGVYPVRTLRPASKTGAAEAWARGMVYVFLKHATASNVIRGPATPANIADEERVWAEWRNSREPGALIFSGRFATENEARLGGLMGRVYSGGDSSAYFPAVPLGRYDLWHMRQDELGHRDLDRVAEELRRAPWHYSAGRDLKKSETVRGIALDARGQVKWIKPDPFARK